MENWQEIVLTKVREFVETKFAGRFEIYNLQLKQAKRRLFLCLQIEGPNPIRIRDCEEVSKALEAFLDQEDLIHQHYILEVSSPGVERELRRPIDFHRHCGKLVNWILKEDENNPKEVFQARLESISSDDVISVLTVKGRKSFPLSRVEKAKTVFEFPSQLLQNKSDSQKSKQQNQNNKNSSVHPHRHSKGR